jgi:hypothetical protein
MNTLQALFLALSLISAGLMAGCDGAIDSAYEEKLVLSAFLFAGEHLDSVILERTIPFGTRIDDEAIAVDGAEITISSNGETFNLLPIAGRKGRYYLPDHVIEGGRKYDIEVRAGKHTLTSSTIVPMPIKFIGLNDSLPPSRVMYLDTNNYGAFTYGLKAGPEDPTHTQYLMQVTSLDVRDENKIRNPPPGPPVDTTASSRYSFFRVSPDFRIVPSLISHFGKNRIAIHALDSNWLDYHRMVIGTRGNYQPSLNHVKGGLGVFGSSARDTVTVLVRLRS